MVEQANLTNPDIQYLLQILSLLEDTTNKLENAYNSKNIEELEKAKKIILELGNRTIGVLERAKMKIQ